jgi:GDP-L-fucose synthase
LNPRTRIYVAGGDTLVGRALLDHLHSSGKGVCVGFPPDEPDLTSPNKVQQFFAKCRPEIVIVASGLTGGIGQNQNCPADLMEHNLLTATHVLGAACRHGVRKLLYLGSSCMYPRQAPQPLMPESLHIGPLEPTSAAYATAKLAGLLLCQAYRRQYGARFISAIPANAFGPHDDFHPDSGHVIPSLMGRMHIAQLCGDPTVTIWGTGQPRREFVYASDLADACLFVLDHYDGDEPINLGTGLNWSIAETAVAIADVVGYRGRLCFDPAKPDGVPRKCLDSSKLSALGWKPKTSLRAALIKTYAWYAANVDHIIDLAEAPVPEDEQTVAAGFSLRS